MATEQQIPALAGALVSKQKCFEPLPVSDAQWVTENAEEAIGLFIKAVKNRDRKMAQIVKRTLTAWKTITVGGTTAKALIAEIEKVKSGKEKNEVGDYARDIMGKSAFVIAPSAGQVDLVILTLRDLGLTSNPRTDAFLTKEFCAKWSAENLDGYVIELCEPEDGPQLRLQYQDQPKGEVLYIAMERIAVSDGSPSVFRVERRVERGGGRWLHAGWARPGDWWPLGLRVVFRLRKLPSPSAT